MYIEAAVLLLGAISAQAFTQQALLREQWENFKVEHGKFYQNEDEELYRQGVFMENLHKITQHNIDYERGLTSFKMGVNYMADLTSEEFLQLYTIQMNFNSSNFDLSEDYDDDDEDNSSDTDVIEDLVDLPGAIDWRSKGAVTPVKNQGQCGSCWSFSATGALEAQWFKKTGRLISLSEQNLVDCSRRYHTHGCNGGNAQGAFQYIKENGGIDTESAYPYVARDGICHFNRRGIGARVRSFERFRGEGTLQYRVASVGPIAVAVEAGPLFQMYHSGVYDNPRCGHKLNHAMMVVGYGNERGRNYWLVKNSWGHGWGDQGYIKMSRSRGNQCGIADEATYPIV